MPEGTGFKMSISEFEIKRCERELDKFLLEHRPPVEIRDKVDISYRIANQSVELFTENTQVHNNMIFHGCLKMFIIT